MTTTTVSPTGQSAGVVNFASGSFTSDGNATVLQTGFTARAVDIVNITDAIEYKWMSGMSNDTALSYTAGASGACTMAAMSSGGITVSAGEVDLASGVVGTSKHIVWTARG